MKQEKTIKITKSYDTTTETFMNDSFASVNISTHVDIQSFSGLRVGKVLEEEHESEFVFLQRLEHLFLDVVCDGRR